MPALATPAVGVMPSEAASASAPEPAVPVLEGTERGWLRVLDAEELLRSLRAADALEAMWRQSRLAAVTWQRDLLPAIHRLAEFVQLMPASESHHHAHVGGLLTHTLEMTLAAMTWRNGHFLPAGAAIEQIDAERDEWTYVVFYAALLHDIAKPMTDLRIQWRAARMPEPLRWTPMGGSLVQLAAGRQQAEYRVEFTPRSARDYSAHSRLALTILHQIAPATALAFLARTPHALDTLTHYLSGQDRASLVAKIVMRADQVSTAKALQQGSRARFDTATSVPLIELLMGALKAMLKSGTALPLNRSGAAGWVHDGSIWFVAKRVADAVRAWLKDHAPDESIPGDRKNDRLFDTWQEYGCIQVNPHTGQAVWYVTVHGEAGQGEQEAGQGSGQGSGQGANDGSVYTHNLTMLRFPLARLYDDASQYPPEMCGRIEVKPKRPDKPGAEEDLDAADGEDRAMVVQDEAISLPQLPASPELPVPAALNESQAEAARQQSSSRAKPGESKSSRPALRAPSFNKPKPAATKAATPKPAAKPAGSTGAAKEQEAGPVPPTSVPSEQASDVIVIGGGIDGFDAPDSGWLDEDDDVRSLSGAAAPKVRAMKPTASARPVKAPTPAASPATGQETAAMPRLPEAVAARTAVRSGGVRPPKKKPEQTAQETRQSAAVRPLFQAPGLASNAGAHTTARAAVTAPIVLTPSLPELPQDTASRKAEPSEKAIAFMHWLQQGLAARVIKYNESGAPVHFTEEGMALVSPLIFKLYARETGPEPEAEATGLQVQREVIKAGWHRMGAGQGRSKVNILRYEVLGRGGASVGRLSAIVLMAPDRWVLPVPPANPVLRLMQGS